MPEFYIRQRYGIAVRGSSHFALTVLLSVSHGGAKQKPNSITLHFFGIDGWIVVALNAENQGVGNAGPQ